VKQRTYPKAASIRDREAVESAAEQELVDINQNSRAELKSGSLYNVYIIR
jgi:hypothetical protein